MQMDGEEGTAPAPGRWGIAPFYVEQRPQASAAARFNFRAPTTGRNALRVLRALQVCTGEGRHMGALNCLINRVGLFFFLQQPAAAAPLDGN